MSTQIVWDPNSGSEFTTFDAAINAANDQIQAARKAVENLNTMNRGLTMTALYDNFTGELLVQWQNHLSNLEGFLAQAKASYQAAMDQDAANAKRPSP